MSQTMDYVPAPNKTRTYAETALVKGYVYMWHGIRLVIFKKDHEKIKAGKFVRVIALNPQTGWTGEVMGSELTPVFTNKVSSLFGAE
jgi:hypothetical protein